MFETFTKHARAAIDRAQQEARDTAQTETHIEHLLLGLLSRDSGLDQLWAQFGLTVEPVRDQVRQRLTETAGTLPSGPLPFATDAQEALQSGYRLGMGEPGPAHILVAVIGRGEGSPSEILSAVGADPAQVRFEAKKLIAIPADAQTITSASGQLHGTTTGVFPDLDFGT